MKSMLKQACKLLGCITGALLVLDGSAQSNAPVTGIHQSPAASGTAVAPPAAYVSGNLYNYLRSWDAQQPYTDAATLMAVTDVTKVRQSTQYADGLGRSIEAVGYQASPGKTDMVSAQVYDAYGRESYKYLPYTSPANTGAFKANPFGEQATFYGSTYISEQPAYRGESFYYGHINYEPSPLNRVQKSFAAGNSWAGSEGGSAEKSVQISYLVNTGTSTTGDMVPVWTIAYNSLTYSNNDVTTNIPQSTTTYTAGNLYKTVTIDDVAMQ
jgi:hypothetical protein